ncbi:MAG: MBG domain-containing protein [Lacrimispora sp.]|uniref:MBG domain-containing protein n=1 Tax=Lacrimispora sp. TaxID=2719234 RepID=UPI0039E4CC8D
MKQGRRKFRQGLAGFLALCLTMTSFNMVSWADVERAFDHENAVFMISGEELRSSAQAAIDSGETFHAADLGLGDEDPSLKREYEKLFGNGLVYEFNPGYYMEEEAGADGAELRMFIRTADTDGGYLLTGEEEIIFLYVNESDGRITFRSNIDGYLTQKVSVKAFSESAAAIPGGPQTQPETALPDGNAVNPGEPEAGSETGTGAAEETKNTNETGSAKETKGSDETGSAEGTKGSEETKGPDETGSVKETKDSDEAETGNGTGTAGETEDSTEAEGGAETGSGGTSGDESQTSSQEPSGNADAGSDPSDTGSSNEAESEADNSQSGDEGAKVQASISRHMLSVLTSSDTSILKTATPSDSESENREEPAGGTVGDSAVSGTSKGKTYGAVLLDESYYAKAYVTTLNQLHVDTSAEGYRVTYSVEPVGTAYAQGPGLVEENGTLSFGVTPQVGYEINAVTINGESAVADEVKDPSENDKTLHYTVTDVTEDQEIVITTTATGEHPEFKFEQTMNGVTVSLYAAPGILPAGTEARITEVTQKVEEAVKEKAAEDGVNDVLAYDIKLYADGEELDNGWSSHGYVNVTFSGAPIEEKSQHAERVGIMYVDLTVDVASEAVQKISVKDVSSLEDVVETIAVEEGTQIGQVSFDAEHFSVYTVTFASKAELKVHVMDAKTKQEIGKTVGNFTQSASNGQQYTSSSFADTILNKMGEDIKKQYYFSKATKGSDFKGSSLESFYYNKGKIYSDYYWPWIYSNELTDIYLWYNSYEVTFNPNGGTGDTQTLKVNGSFSLPQPSALGISRDGHLFAGWSTNQKGQGEQGNEAERVYVPGVQRSVSNSTTTYYAIWIDVNGQDSDNTAYFFIKEGTDFAIEPASYGTTGYYPKESAEILKGKLRSPVSVNNNLDNVRANLREVPGNDEISEVLKGTRISFNPNTQHILWYVIKLRKTGNGKTYWNVDGVVRDNGKYNLVYLPNGGEASNLPESKPYTQGESVTIRYDKIPPRLGYMFLGWDENPDAGTPAYVKGNGKKLRMPGNNVTLYAIWKPDDTTEFKVNHWLQIPGTSGTLQEHFTKSKESPETKFSATESTVSDETYIKEFSGYWYKEGIIDHKTSEIVSGDRTTVLNLYYLKKNAVTVTAKSLSRAYNGQPLTGESVGYEVTGIGSEEQIEVALSGSVQDVGTTPNAIENIVIRDKSGNDITGRYEVARNNGTLSVTPATVTITANDQQRPYGTGNSALTFQPPSGFIGPDTLETLGVAVSLTTEADETSKVDVYPINFVSPVYSKGNYVFDYKPGNLTVNKAAAKVIANDVTKEYGKGIPPLIYRIEGFKNDERPDNLGLGIMLLTNANKTSPPGGDYSITFESQPQAVNYSIEYVPGKLTVTSSKARITIAASGAVKVYDGNELTNSDFKYSGTLAEGDRIVSVTMTEDSRITDAGTKKNRIASYQIVNTAGENVTEHYENVRTIDGLLVVTKAPAVIMAKSTSRVYGASNPELGYTAAGFAKEERLSDLGIEPRLKTTAKKDSPAGFYPITFDKPVLITKNYVIAYIPGTLVVTKNDSEVVIMAGSESRIYDGTALTNNEFQVMGSLAEEDYVDSVEMTEDSVITNAGTQKNKIKSVIIKNKAGKDVTKNYSRLTLVPGNLAVSKAQLTVTAIDKAKAYGEENPTLKYEVTGYPEHGVPLEEKITLDTAATRNSPPGTYDITFIDPPSVTDNYTIAYVKGILTVGMAEEEIVFTASDAEKVYDGTELSKAEYSVTGSLKPKDRIVKVVMTEDSKITNAGTQPNRISYVVIENENGDNVTEGYRMAVKDGTLTVSKASITVTAADKSKTQGNANPALTYVIEGLVNGETAEALGLKPQLMTGADRTSVAGNYAITFMDPVLSLDNYQVIYKDGVLTVNRRPSGGSTGGSGGGGSSPASDRPFVPGGPGALVVIEPNQIPLATLPEEGEAEYQTPLAGLPKTGDRNVMPNLAAIITGVLLAAYAMITGKRKEEK